MESFRSKSCRDDGRRDMQLEFSGGPKPNRMNHDMRSYSSTNHASYPPPPSAAKEIQMKKGKKTSGVAGLGSNGKSWSFNDPELKRKKRVAGYKVYAVENKMKGSIRKSFRWIKDVVFGRR